jgi:DNA processing protein
LGCGPDICYPEENKDVYDLLPNSGGIISEYPPGMEPISSFFPKRNRIISGLSDVLRVVEARQKSGTSITVDTALEKGREVLAVPGRVTDRLCDGCNYLISQGAGVAINVEDVLDRLWQLKKPKTAYIPDDNTKHDLYDDEMAVAESKEPTIEDDILSILDIIPVSTSYIMEELYRRGRDTSIPILMATLMDMTGCGKIAQNGAYYRRVS